MLKVKSSFLSEKNKVEIDDYIPIAFTSLDTPCLVHLHWRSGDLQKSLISIGLNPEDGAILSVDIIQIDKIEFVNKNILFPEGSLSCIDGVPICDINCWGKNRCKDEPSKLRFIIYQASVLILFDSHSKPTSQYKASSTSFYINELNDLCGISFCNINQADIERITNTVT